MNSIRPSFSSRKRVFLSVLVIFLAATQAGHATSRTWENTTTDNTWATAGNWSATGTPGATDTLIFDTSGTTTPITVGTNSVAKIIEFGATSDSSSTLAYTLGTTAHSGTITFAADSGTGTNLTANILYQGSNTVTETINSDILSSAGTAPGINIVNTTNSGVLTINGNISNSAATAGSIVVKGSGNINFNGILGSAVGSGNVASSVLTVAMTAGTLTITGSNIAPTGNIALGNSTYSGGNVLIETSNPWGSSSNNLLNLAAGTNGTFQLEGTVSNPNLTLPNGFNTAVARAAGDAGGAADIENISGNNSMGSLTFGPGVKTNGYLNVESDADTLTVTDVTDSRTGGSATGLETVLFYGAGNGTVSGTISDSTTTGDNVGIAKDGTGTWVLKGNSTYSGGTTITSGTLQVSNTSGSATGSGAVALGAATLTGTGIISGTVTANGGANSIITPGTISSIGNLSLGGVNSLSGLTLSFAINGIGNTTSTLTLGSGGLTSTGGTLTFNLYDLGQGDLAADTPYTIITSTGSLSASSISANLINSAYVLDTNYGTDGILISGNTVSFEVEVATVPEPGTWALLLGGLAIGFIYRKRVIQEAE